VIYDQGQWGRRSSRKKGGFIFRYNQRRARSLKGKIVERGKGRRGGPKRKGGEPSGGNTLIRRREDLLIRGKKGTQPKLTDKKGPEKGRRERDILFRLEIK